MGFATHVHTHAHTHNRNGSCFNAQILYRSRREIDMRVPFSNDTISD